ncbi:MULTISPECIES: acetylornithine deacetylase [unclassified Rhizobium]|uniref:acetylornithine deacetylase n=1 Tax=unclassified Rhizobium TaxID=2613769 RepID=UPI001609CC64|nr:MULTISPECIES: acetylornithine deacetylase [unclassified Rhizobium]MBB3286826.1 acetylornithine deacetylase [Rhizobium sp. BK252]MBB3401566.1 acetylornithine deacetylase [Rhizobium sp. BK289]MBB3414490.1 acetylornithine deacetylase [Rhizobium sp. BK284]MBB3482378.1 acetylornithine deacetylase [Rhizobium sp. BK347]
MQAADILARLVGFDSIVGTPNAEIVQWISTYLKSFGATVDILAGPEGDRSNLFATIGPRGEPGYVLSGHMDVVPANEAGWESNPFVLRPDGERLYGRGTSDMKGFLAASLAAVPMLAASTLLRPIHLAFSYDEEAGCRGVPHLIARLPELCETPLGVIVGEPSNMRAILAHKGKSAARIILKGRSGHSSRPDLGLNAIHAAADVLQAAVSAAHSLARGPFEAEFEPPYSSISVGTIHGGQALNIIPDLCTLEVEARAISGADPAALLLPVHEAAAALERRGFQIQWEELSSYPALSLPQTAPLAGLLTELIGTEPLAAVSYGTEAGLYQRAGLEAIICGPGDIARAHKPNEFILTHELTACQAMIEALGRRCMV